MKDNNTVNLSAFAGAKISKEVLHNYFTTLVNLFYKILPMKESGETSLATYMRSLQAELIGCGNVVEEIHDDGKYLSLISILQYMIDNPDLENSEVKRYVFSAISVCNGMKGKYASGTEE